MARKKLTALLPKESSDSAPEASSPVAEPQPATAPEHVTEAAAVAAAPERSVAAETAARAVRPRRAPKPRTAVKDAPGTAALPPYLRFDRKETRLRADQLVELSTRARQLNKQKHPEADRITDNTLIRVAVDLLISRVDELAGGDEDELRRSLGL